MVINVVQDFNQIKIAQDRHVRELIEKLNMANILNKDSHIELNIEGCITDYPATPQLIDYFLFHLSKLNGTKELVVKLDGLGNKLVYLLYILVLEGKFFEISNKIENEDEVYQWTTLMEQRLKENNIILKIIYSPNNKEYIYGK